MNKFRPVTFIVSFCLLLTFCMSAFSLEVIVTEMKGNIEVYTVNTWKKATTDIVLTEKDRVRTGKNSSCALLFKEGHKIQISQNTELKMEVLTDQIISLMLEQGKARSNVKKLSQNQQFGIKTQTAVCSIRGTDFSVEFNEGITRIEVYEGVVSALEETTNREVLLNPGQFTTIEEGKPPVEPQTLQIEGLKTERSSEEIRDEAQREIFQEISREQVMSRAAEEIKLAEYQNGKSVIDASGSRVRLEEYIVRPADNQFKYVVLNTRENRFDFGTILFYFNKPLPTDLTLATKTMFESDSASNPEYIWTAVDSVMSNTYDKALEESTGGDMVWSSKYNVWIHSWGGSSKFYIGNLNSTENGGRGKLMYTYKDTNSNGIAETTEYSAGDLTLNSFDPASYPSGADKIHIRNKDDYSGDNWVQADDYIINDDGKIATRTDVASNLYELNFERVLTSSLFEGRKIDLLFSSKLLIDSGIFPKPANTTQTASVVRLN